MRLEPHTGEKIVFIKITADAKVKLNYINNVYIYPQILGKLSQIYWFYISLHIYFSLNKKKILVILKEKYLCLSLCGFCLDCLKDWLINAS